MPSRRFIRGRSAFTLVELLVALVLVDMGLLAVVASGAALVREFGSASLRAGAITAAESRFEQIAAAPCDGDNTGSAELSPAIVESWSAVSDSGTRVRTLVVTERYRDVVPSRWHEIVLSSRAPC